MGIDSYSLIQFQRKIEKGPNPLHKHTDPNLSAVKNFLDLKSMVTLSGLQQKSSASKILLETGYGSILINPVSTNL